MIPFTTRSTCRACGGADLQAVLALGATPLANALVSDPSAPDERLPLDLVFCGTCSLVQITQDVASEVLFRDYVYFSSYSDTVLESARVLASALIGERALKGDSLVVEIASNDGYLLRNYLRHGIRVLGIEPARNVAAAARAQGIETLEEFFSRDLASSLPRADVVHAHNVLAHVADLNGFVEGLATLVREDGVIVIEVPYVRDLIENLEFDTIYHEHLCYFSLTALTQLFARHGLTVGRVERIAMHGGSLRLFAGHAPTVGESVKALLAQEEAWGICSFASYADFGSRVLALSAELRQFLAELKRKGKRIAGYGASAKGTTLLSFCGVGGETLDFVVDRSTVKQGKLTPGTRLPILPLDQLVARMPDYVLLLSWNFAEEIIGQQQEYRRLGGRFVIPIPSVEVV